MVMNNAALKRAHHPEQRQQRRAAIVAAGRSLLEAHGYDAVAMLDIARAAGVAKGTLYLYFPTKEALFLELLGSEYAACFDALDAALTAMTPPASAETVADAVSGTLVARPLFLKLVALLHIVLEHNISPAEARSFKMFLRERTEATGARLEALLPQLAAGEGARMLLNVEALAVGWRHLAEPAPVIADLLAESQLALFRVDFAPAFHHSLAALIRGWHNRS